MTFQTSADGNIVRLDTHGDEAFFGMMVNHQEKYKNRDVSGTLRIAKAWTGGVGGRIGNFERFAILTGISRGSNSFFDHVIQNSFGFSVKVVQDDVKTSVVEEAAATIKYKSAMIGLHLKKDTDFTRGRLLMQIHDKSSLYSLELQNGETLLQYNHRVSYWRDEFKFLNPFKTTKIENDVFYVTKSHNRVQDHIDFGIRMRDFKKVQAVLQWQWNDNFAIRLDASQDRYRSSIILAGLEDVLTFHIGGTFKPLRNTFTPIIQVFFHSE